MFSGDPGHWKSASQERDFDRDETPQFPEPFPNSLQETATEVDCHPPQNGRQLHAIAVTAAAFSSTAANDF